MTVNLVVLAYIRRSDVTLVTVGVMDVEGVELPPPPPPQPASKVLMPKMEVRVSALIFIDVFFRVSFKLQNIRLILFGCPFL